MKKNIKQGIIVWGIPCLLATGIFLLRWFPAGAEIYTHYAYPLVSCLLSAFSSIWPFSVGDVFMAGACLWLVGYPFYAWKRKKGVWPTLGKMGRFLLWMYVWFYLAWGINYFRPSFYERAEIARTSYAEDDFRQFLEEYIGGLKGNYLSTEGDGDWYAKSWWKTGEQDKASVEEEITRGYREIAGRFKLVSPDRVLPVKWMLWSKAMSKVGVTGYMGPFFAEFNLNRELLNVEYPFTYAHELAHRLGVSSEAEANLCAFLITTNSSEPRIRFSGYFALLGYVMNNARRLLPAEEYRELLQKIPPEVIGMYRQHLEYWRGKYTPWLGQIQQKVYNAYLKGNKISGGTKNYSEVIGLLMAWIKSGKEYTGQN